MYQSIQVYLPISPSNSTYNVTIHIFQWHPRYAPNSSKWYTIAKYRLSIVNCLGTGYYTVAGSLPTSPAGSRALSRSRSRNTSSQSNNLAGSATSIPDDLGSGLLITINPQILTSWHPSNAVLLLIYIGLSDLICVDIYIQYKGSLNIYPTLSSVLHLHTVNTLIYIYIYSGIFWNIITLN